MQKWLDSNGILIYSTHYECTLVIIEKFIKTLKPEIYKQNKS